MRLQQQGVRDVSEHSSTGHAPCFPSEYIHMGGDEVSKTAWEQSPLCQTYMKAQGLKDAAELQSHFLKRIEQGDSVQRPSHGRMGRHPRRRLAARRGRAVLAGHPSRTGCRETGT